jgi:hypothetical protein
MNVNLPITDAEEYFQNYEGKEIDFDENDSSKISIAQYYELSSILTLDIAYYALRHSIGFCGSHVDNIRNLRNYTIEEYENKWKVEYKYPNNELL